MTTTPPPPTLDRLPPVVTLNLQALELLRHGQYEEAMGKLKVALSQVKQCPPSSSSSSMSSTTSLDELNTWCDRKGCLAAVDMNPLFVYVPGENTESLENSGQQFHLHNKGLILSGLDEFALCGSPEREMITTAVLSYNLAMAYHLKALQLQQWKNQVEKFENDVSHHYQHHQYFYDGGDNEMMFHCQQKAMRIYGMIAAMIGIVQNQDCIPSFGSWSRDESLILMLVVNNQGHLHFHLEQRECVKACVETLCDLLESNFTRMSFMGCEITAILVNVLLHGERKHHAPAA